MIDLCQLVNRSFSWQVKKRWNNIVSLLFINFIIFIFIIILQQEQNWIKIIFWCISSFIFKTEPTMVLKPFYVFIIAKWLHCMIYNQVKYFLSWLSSSLQQIFISQVHLLNSTCLVKQVNIVLSFHSSPEKTFPICSAWT